MLVVLLLLAAVDATSAAATAAIGYEPDPSQPTISLGSQYAHGIAVDQKNGRIYVAVVSKDLGAGADGLVDQLESDGVTTASSPFTGGTYAFFAGVAVNPLTGGIYASQVAPPYGGGYIGETKMDLFSPAGVSGGSFALGTSHQVVPQLATDSAGNVYYPSDATGAVQEFNTAGGLEREISCASCPGGRFTIPVSVAIDGAGDLYVVDLGTDRVVELAPSGGSYTYFATVQSGEDAVAVGVDPALNDVFVGDLDGGVYHIVAYNASGTQFDDFGAGLFATVEHPSLAWQIAVNASTHLLYATNEGELLVFQQAPISPPVASGAAASSVGQLTATLNATLNAEGHAVLSCRFEYAEAADSGYANARTAPCSALPYGTAGTAISTRLTSLSPSTSYRYRVVAENNGGSTTGSEEVFETLPAVPATIGADAVSEVSETGATLGAKVNPHGGTTSECYFEYGRTPSYGSKAACGRLPEPASTEVSETVKVSGLALSTSYDYRLVVTTNAGTTEGDNAEFTTLAQQPTVTTESTSTQSSATESTSSVTQTATSSTPSSSTEAAQQPPPSHVKPAPRSRRCQRHSGKRKAASRSLCACRSGSRRAHQCAKKKHKHKSPCGQSHKRGKLKCATKKKGSHGSQKMKSINALLSPYMQPLF